MRDDDLKDKDKDKDKDKKRTRKHGQKSYDQDYDHSYDSAGEPVSAREERVMSYSEPDQGSVIHERVAALETKINWLLGASGLTIAVVVSLAFWLGSTLARLDTTLTQSTQKTDKVYEVVLTNTDSLNARTKVIESKLDDIEKKLPARK